MSQRHATGDSAWKQLLDRHLDEFLEFFFPEVRVDLDLRRGYRPLDKELEQLAAKSRSGLRLADKVVEVYLRDGSPIALIIHIEVQGHVDRTFEKRMFTYNYRLFDRFDREVVSLAVLTDANPEFRPQRLRFERWGYLLRFEFPSVKLLDWNDRTEELKASRNPFALVTLAHLDLQTCRTPRQRLEFKKRLLERFFLRGWKERDIIGLFRFVDWLISLPHEMEQELDVHLRKMGKAKAMPYVSGFERRAEERGRRVGLEEGQKKGLEEGLEQGREQGRIDGVRKGLREALSTVIANRFGSEGEALREAIDFEESTDFLRDVLDQVLANASLNELYALVLRRRSSGSNGD